MNVILIKFKEVLFSVLPITLIVMILNFTLTPIGTPLFIRFIIGAVLIVIGLTLFLTGVGVGLSPMGELMGANIAKTNKLWVVIIAGLVLGFFISIAEPALNILAGQVDAVSLGMISKNSLVVVVSMGIAIMLSIGLVRIVYNFPLYKLLSISYGVILILAIFTSEEFLGISFDSSGATTGTLTVPLILALSMGVSRLKKDSKSSESDSFGLLAVVSAGAIISVMLMNILSKMDKLEGSLPMEKISTSTSILKPFLAQIPKVSGEVLFALLPIVLIFIVIQAFSSKLSRNLIRKLFFGVLFTFFGVVLFLIGVNAGFMDVGNVIGYSLASMDNKSWVVALAFILGMVTVIAEPAVHVLTTQIEQVTSGYVKKKIVTVTLSIGIGIAIALSILRILIPC